MQIAAMNPVAIDKDFVNPRPSHRRLKLEKNRPRRDGKPEEML